MSILILLAIIAGVLILAAVLGGEFERRDYQRKNGEDCE